MITRIELHHVLPDVFSDATDRQPVCSSQVWLRDVTFHKGRRYMIEAESGTGKSSLCSFIYGNRRDYSGAILFDGQDTRSFSPSRWSAIRKTSIALLPQEMRLFPQLTVLENIDIKNRLTYHASPQEIMNMLERVELAHKADTPAGLLSIGQQQRVAIVRALCQPMDFILLDEPVSHLDSRNNQTVASLIADEASRQGATIIATSVGNKINIPDPEIIRL